MNIFKIAYMPSINDSVVKYVKENCEPSMIDLSGETGQYSIDDVIEAYEDLHIDDSILNELRKENIDYVEI